jgi:maltose O-acetyltransferase
MTFKEKMMRRVARTVLYYAQHESMDQLIARHRASGVTIGERTNIFDTAIDPVFPGLLTIGDDCIITGSAILTHDGSLVPSQGLQRAGRVVIGDRVFVGLRTVILPGVTIGSDVIIGAGSIVARDVPDRMVFAGNPAPMIASLDEWLARREDDPNVMHGMAIGLTPPTDEVTRLWRAEVDHRL